MYSVSPQVRELRAIPRSLMTERQQAQGKQVPCSLCRELNQIVAHWCGRLCAAEPQDTLPVKGPSETSTGKDEEEVSVDHRTQALLEAEATKKEIVPVLTCSLGPLRFHCQPF